jgi:hypothetical protein
MLIVEYQSALMLNVTLWPQSSRQTHRILFSSVVLSVAIDIRYACNIYCRCCPLCCLWKCLPTSNMFTHFLHP